MLVWLALIPAGACVVFLSVRRRVQRVRDFARWLGKVNVAESVGDLVAAETALEKADQSATCLGKALRPGAARAVQMLRARLRYKQGNLEESAALTYELLQQARAAT